MLNWNLCRATKQQWTKQYSGKENVSVTQLKYFFSNLHYFKLWVLHENIMGELIKQSKHWWHKQQQKFCWADLFKPQIKDKTAEELMVIKHNGNVSMEIWK